MPCHNRGVERLQGSPRGEVPMPPRAWLVIVAAAIVLGGCAGAGPVGLGGGADTPSRCVDRISGHSYRDCI
jgi:hypothetical protein